VVERGDSKCKGFYYLECGYSTETKVVIKVAVGKFQLSVRESDFCVETVTRRHNTSSSLRRSNNEEATELTNSGAEPEKDTADAQRIWVMKGWAIRYVAGQNPSTRD
jgi:hypothetical protein